MSKKPPDDAIDALADYSNIGAAYRGAGSHIRHSIEDIMPILVRTACNVKDAVRGREQLSNVVGDAYYAKFGASIKAIEVRLAHMEAEKASAQNDLEAARELDAETPELLQTAKVNSGQTDDHSKEVPWRDWQMRHKVETCVLLSLLAGALTASTVTARTNLIATGLPIFLEDDWIAWTMAGLAPASGLVLKLIASDFKSEKAHRVFSIALNTAATILVLSWVVLFADQFKGVGSDITGGLFDEPTVWDSIKSTVFVAVTLLTEISIGAVVADRLDQILRNYSPTHWHVNLISKALKKRVAAFAALILGYTNEEADLKGSLEEFDRSLQLQVNLALLIYDARRARFDEDTLA